MTKQDNTGSFKLNIGGPSIILLLTVLGLSVFAIFSIRAAYSGLKLSKTSEEAAEKYYRVEGIAQTTEFNINECVTAFRMNYDGDTSFARDNLEKELRKLEYVKSVEEGTIIYEIPAGDYLLLHVQLTGNMRYENLKITDHRMIAKNLEGYSGSGLDINTIEIQ